MYRRRAQSNSPATSLRQKDPNITPQKQTPKLDFTIFQDSPSADGAYAKDASLKDEDMEVEDTFSVDNVERDDKENEVSKENLEPASTAHILNCDNLLNNNIIRNQNHRGPEEANRESDFVLGKSAIVLNQSGVISNFAKRNPLSSKSIVLYPGFLELLADPTASSRRRDSNSADVYNNQWESRSSININKVKQRILHLPKKSSPLKPLSLSSDVANENNSAFNTPLRFGSKELSKSPLTAAKDSISRKSTSIFSSPSSSPYKSKLTNKLLSLATNEDEIPSAHNNKSNDSVFSKLSSNISSMSRSKSRLNDKSVLGIPTLSSFNSDFSQKQKVFRDSAGDSSNTMYFSPKKKLKTVNNIMPNVSAKSSSASLCSDYSAALSALNSPSDKSTATNPQSSNEDFMKFKRLDVLWIPEPSLQKNKDVVKLEKKAINKSLEKILPTFVTPPRVINKQTLSNLLTKAKNSDAQNSQVTIIKKSNSLININETVESHTARISLGKRAREDNPHDYINDDPNDIHFGEGINDGFQASRNRKARITVNRAPLKFQIFSDN